MEEKAYDAVIIGAGPAGLACALKLAETSRKVLVVEKHTLPREKVCGGFIGPENLPLFHRHHLVAPLLAEGAVKITHIGLSSYKGTLLRLPIPGLTQTTFGLGVSRKLLDWKLALRAKELGVDIAEYSTVKILEAPQQLEIHDRKWKLAYPVRTKLLINAGGALQHPSGKKFSFVGIAAMFKNVSQMGDCVYLHFSESGHVGVNSFEHHETNVCYVVDPQLFHQAGGDGQKIFDFFLKNNPALENQMSQAVKITRWKGVTVPPFPKPRFFENKTLFTGDAVSLIHPVTGGGISLALESGTKLGEFIHGFFEGKLSESQLVQQYKTWWYAKFYRRVQWSKFWGYVSHQKYMTGAVLSALKRAPAQTAALFNSYHVSY